MVMTKNSDKSLSHNIRPLLTRPVNKGKIQTCPAHCGAVIFIICVASNLNRSGCGTGVISEDAESRNGMLRVIHRCI